MKMWRSERGANQHSDRSVSIKGTSEVGSAPDADRAGAAIAREKGMRIDAG